MDTLRLALLAGILLTAVLLNREVSFWRSGRSTATPRQRIIRLSSGISVILLLGLILVDATLGILFTADRRILLENPALAFAYFSAYMGVACLLIFLALLDVREALRVARHDRAQMHRELHEKDGER